MPAGKLELGETLGEAAAREVREETGVEVEVERLVGIWHCPETSEGFAVVNFVFAGRAAGGAVAARRMTSPPRTGASSRTETFPSGKRSIVAGVKRRPRSCSTSSAIA